MTSPSRNWLKLMCPTCGMDFQQKAPNQLLCGSEKCKRAWGDVPETMRRAWRWAVAKLAAAKRGEA